MSSILSPPGVGSLSQYSPPRRACGTIHTLLFPLDSPNKVALASFADHREAATPAQGRDLPLLYRGHSYIFVMREKGAINTIETGCHGSVIPHTPVHLFEDGRIQFLYPFGSSAIYQPSEARDDP
ncbi:MAG: hypothetical protein MZV63_37090 [Marinilabiliales bacterium]|nr:hypothetical protein [Marinilabiliales bacterium]